MGPTASGKSEVAERLADRLDAQLINADAFQIYRGFDIGTNKPDRREAYALLDIKDPHEPFGVGEWIAGAIEVLNACYTVGRHAVIVGGTGYYIRALMDEWQDLAAAPDPALRDELERLREEQGLEALAQRLVELDPGRAASIDLQNPHRVRRALERALAPTEPIRFVLPPFRKLKWGLSTDVETLNERIDARVEEMVTRGWLEEVERLLRSGVAESDAAMRAIGYRSLAQVVENDVSIEEAIEIIKRETRQYAKRQRTWLRSERVLHWAVREEWLEQLNDKRILEVNLEALLRGVTITNG